jgi:hypothetical protein
VADSLNGFLLKLYFCASHLMQRIFGDEYKLRSSLSLELLSDSEKKNSAVVTSAVLMIMAMMMEALRD